jgi:hypothetical protein
MIHQLQHHASPRDQASAEHSYVRDRSRIDVDRFWDMRYWSSKFEVRPEELRKAVEVVGPSPYAVAQYLGRAR